ncbi:MULTISPECIES: DUF433 domain-containing protein [Komagataeibacter]|uniref:DUF433 domain-containing protein n=1 Tax=Komagataeibacter rhaeticus TaxID=215221 RepID=A0A181CEM1_9PROT|nr:MULTISPECIES: DUF433 domain-containing protein [Komagataeibacter]AZV40673.1 DUF433 domain-containing protein [Komagataeibacter xylinus]QIP36620.1 DUF433 domain-containing protein [Komagataeibacter rhaeticus]QIP37206.1 DUF433 domain-containing protein [Komagataeibacter rhaeticus]QOC46391.1 DUF433 domain-containing protein [Komagataeibacter rhaeticus]QOC48341.1 DUF433 domain-containing protein [Komagataeibacter rhaeticus]
MIEIQPVTLREAQFLIGMSEKDINRAIDRGEVEKISEPEEDMPVHGVGKGRRRVRKIGLSELLFLALEKQMHADLTPTGRRKLYQAFKKNEAKARTVSFGPFKANITEIQRNFLSKYKKLLDAKKNILEEDGADPVIKGTGISAYRVAALAQGQTIKEIKADYPTLTEEQIESAIAYTEAYPKPGRPYPVRSFRRAAGALAEMGIFDAIETGAESAKE